MSQSPHPPVGILGTVRALRRYPVKSMLGEGVFESDVTVRGLAGDRAWAVLDRSGAVGSVKHPRKWGPLLRCHSWLTGPDTAAVTLPDNRTYDAGSRELDEGLSALLGRDVSLRSTPPERGILERAVPDYAGGVPETALSRAVTDDTGTSITSGALAAGTFFDFGAVHLVTTGSLAALRRSHPAGDVDPRRFRPNLVVETGDGAWFEDDWVGSTVRVGEAEFSVVVPTPRCVVPTLAHDELPADPQLMRTAAREHRVDVLTLGPLTCVGVYLSVLTPGRVRAGDPVTVVAPAHSW